MSYSDKEKAKEHWSRSKDDAHVMLDSTLPRPPRLWVMTSEQQLERLRRLENMLLGGASLPSYRYI